MTRCIVACLLTCLSFLPCRPATAQSAKPLPPIVVQLAVGDVIARADLVAMDTISFRAARIALLVVPAADAVQADLRRQRELAEQQAAAARREVERCRQQGQQREAEYQHLSELATKATGKPPHRFFLLDPAFWKGAAIGGGVGLLFGLTR